MVNHDRLDTCLPEQPHSLPHNPGGATPSLFASRSPGQPRFGTVSPGICLPRGSLLL